MLMETRAVPCAILMRKSLGPQPSCSQQPTAAYVTLYSFPVSSISKSQFHRLQLPWASNEIMTMNHRVPWIGQCRSNDLASLGGAGPMGRLGQLGDNWVRASPDKPLQSSWARLLPPMEPQCLLPQGGRVFEVQFRILKTLLKT